MRKNYAASWILSSCGIINMYFLVKSHPIIAVNITEAGRKKKMVHPDSVEDEGKTLGRKVTPVTQGVYNSSLGAYTQFTTVEQPRW